MSDKNTLLAIKMIGSLYFRTKVMIITPITAERVSERTICV